MKENNLNLKEFILYCKNQIALEKTTQSDIEKILTEVLITKATEMELIDSLNETLTRHYHFLELCVKREKYEECAIINKSINIELNHFKNIARKCNFDILEDFDLINKYHKKRVIDAN